MRLLFAFSSIVTLSATDVEDHSGHDHSGFKPMGPYSGMLTKKTESGKVWNLMEVQVMFHEEKDMFDMKWYYGIKEYPNLVVPKQTFECENVPYKFNEAVPNISIDIDANECLFEVNQNFPKFAQLPSPFVIPFNHDNGDLKFNMVKTPDGSYFVDFALYPIDMELAVIPSGKDGHPAGTTPARRSDDDVTVSPKQAAATTVAPTTTTKNAGSVSAAMIFAVFIAGLVL